MKHWGDYLEHKDRVMETNMNSIKVRQEQIEILQRQLQQAEWDFLDQARLSYTELEIAQAKSAYNLNIK